MSARGLAILIAIAALALPSAVWAHGGGLDGNGCHHDRRAGSYHCHQGPLAGREFGSRKAAETTLWLAEQLAAQQADALAINATAARVVDGDTLDLDGWKVRIQYIDAPEHDQTCRANGGVTPCGQLATTAMQQLVTGQAITCVVVEVDAYGRLLGTCSDGRGADLGQSMVASGWALAYRQYGDRYVRDEDRARAARAGMWAGEFTPPWEWRRGHDR